MTPTTATSPIDKIFGVVVFRTVNIKLHLLDGFHSMCLFEPLFEHAAAISDKFQRKFLDGRKFTDQYENEIKTSAMVDLLQFLTLQLSWVTDFL